MLLAALCLGASVALADEAAVSDLKVDLAEVLKVGKVTPVGGITSAGQPNEAQFRVFADNGYVAVIDLRTADEGRGLDEPAVVASLGMEYVPFPIGRGDITLEKARQLGDLIDSYEQPVLVHCRSANRVGALLALQQYDETGDLEAALAAGREGGMTRLDAAVKKAIKAK